MKKEKILLLIIIPLIIINIAGLIIGSTYIVKIKQIMKSPTSEIIVADTGLTFKTEKGEIISELVVDKESDNSRFRVFNNQGKINAEFGACEFGGILRICDKQGNNIAGMTAGVEGGFLWIYSNYGEQVAELGAYESGYENGGILLIRNNQGKIVAGLKTYEEGGRLSIRNNQGEIVAKLEAGEKGGEFRIFDNQKKIIVELPH